MPCLAGRSHGLRHQPQVISGLGHASEKARVRMLGFLEKQLRMRGILSARLDERR